VFTKFSDAMTAAIHKKFAGPPPKVRKSRVVTQQQVEVAIRRRFVEQSTSDYARQSHSRKD
jgi:hypothetical protein